MAKEVKKKGALWATILGVVMFIVVYMATGAVNGAVQRGAVPVDKIAMVNGLNGIFSQMVDKVIIGTDDGTKEL